MNPVTMGNRYNYVAYFLTLACNLKCPWCINLHEDGSRSEQARRVKMTPDEWVEAANRLVLRDDLPLTLQGGEPTLHKGFYTIVNNVKKEIKMDLLTNMMFDVDRFIQEVPVWRFTRQAPYAPIRVSFHPGQNLTRRQSYPFYINSRFFLIFINVIFSLICIKCGIKVKNLLLR